MPDQSRLIGYRVDAIDTVDGRERRFKGTDLFATRFEAYRELVRYRCSFAADRAALETGPSRSAKYRLTAVYSKPRTSKADSEPVKSQVHGDCKECGGTDTVMHTPAHAYHCVACPNKTFIYPTTELKR